MYGDFIDRYLGVKEKQENASEYLNLSPGFIYIVFLAFLVVSARKRSKLRTHRDQNNDWTGKDAIMYMLLFILLCPKQ